MVLFICGVSIWSFALKFLAEALSGSFAWKFCLEALNKYVIFILLFGSFAWKFCFEALVGSFV